MYRLLQQPSTYGKEEQKKIFKAVAELSKNGYIALQELDYLNIPSKEIEETLIYFEKYGLLKEVQHLGENHPVIFRI